MEVERSARVTLWLIARGDNSPSMKILKKNLSETVRFMPPRSITQVKWPPRFVTFSRPEAV